MNYMNYLSQMKNFNIIELDDTLVNDNKRIIITFKKEKKASKKTTENKIVENKNALAQSQPIQKITSIAPQKQNKIQVNNLSKTISVATNTTNHNSTSNTVILNDAKSSPNNSSVNATVVTPATPINSNTVTSNTQEEAITLQQATISTQKLDNKDIIENTIMSNAVYQEINTESQDNTIHIGMFEINGASLRGITRKVRAIFKKNKTEIENKYEK